MEDVADTLDFIDDVCRRPHMWTLNGTYGEVAALLTGAILQSVRRDERQMNYWSFNCFVTSSLLVPSQFGWTSAIRRVAENDEAAIRRLHDLFREFVSLRESKTFDEIRAICKIRVTSYEEPEPARVWRAFMNARFHADQSIIEDLILPHPEAAVLWEGGGAPPEIAEQLVSLNDLNIVSILSGSVETGNVRLITVLGEIAAKLVDGRWRIDASPIIALDKKDV